MSWLSSMVLLLSLYGPLLFCAAYGFIAIAICQGNQSVAARENTGGDSLILGLVGSDCMPGLRWARLLWNFDLARLIINLARAEANFPQQKLVCQHPPCVDLPRWIPRARARQERLKARFHGHCRQDCRGWRTGLGTMAPSCRKASRIMRLRRAAPAATPGTPIAAAGNG